MHRRMRFLFCLALAVAPAVQAAVADHPCRPVAFENHTYTVCSARLDHHDIRLHLKKPDGSFYSRLQALPDDGLVFAINAGMFTPEMNAAGLYVEDGRQTVALNTRDGPGNFHLKPNGVFWIGDRGAHVTETNAFATLGPSPQLATQSGPMLVIDDKLHPRFEADGASRYIRNGVGVAADGTVHFAISEEPVSFGAFGRLFRDALSCPNALYLDGSVSQLYIPGARATEAGRALGPMFAVYARRP